MSRPHHTKACRLLPAQSLEGPIPGSSSSSSRYIVEVGNDNVLGGRSKEIIARHMREQRKWKAGKKKQRERGVGGGKYYAVCTI